jgi:hypothetical protein
MLPFAMFAKPKKPSSTGNTQASGFAKNVLLNPLKQKFAQP